MAKPINSILFDWGRTRHENGVSGGRLLTNPDGIASRGSKSGDTT
jgi:hypothetical protein